MEEKTIRLVGRMFPNGLGMEVKRSRSGSWDIWFPDVGRAYYLANYFPAGETVATKSGRGGSAEEAVKNAVAVAL